MINMRMLKMLIIIYLVLKAVFEGWIEWIIEFNKKFLKIDQFFFIVIGGICFVFMMIFSEKFRDNFARAIYKDNDE